MGDFKLVLPGAAVILVLSVFYSGGDRLQPRRYMDGDSQSRDNHCGIGKNPQQRLA